MEEQNTTNQSNENLVKNQEECRRFVAIIPKRLYKKLDVLRAENELKGLRELLEFLYEKTTSKAA